MKTKRAKMVLGMGLLLMLGMGVIMVQPSIAQDVCGEATTVTLLAAKIMDVGTVSAWNDASNLYVMYRTTEPWLLDETHLAISPYTWGFPRNRGGQVIPGKFPYWTEHEVGVYEYIYIIGLNGWGPGTTLNIAAHSSIYRVVNDIVEFETAWGEGTRFSRKSWATYFTYTIQGCY